MRKINKTFIICLIILFCCIIMAIADGILQLNYAYKSIVKILLFLGLPALYMFLDKGLKINDVFAVNKKGIGVGIILGIVIYTVILGGYMLLKNVFDFSSITTTLSSNIGVNHDNFILVSLYISFINSMLEEFFFRGFAFITLKKISSRTFAYTFSALAFTIYHIAMMIGWFSILPLIIVLLGLFTGGLIFNYLNEQSGTIYSSWLVHMFANFAINTVGFILFGII